MNMPNPQNISLPILLSEIESGKIKIPQFQRDFVWNIKKSSKLMDSLIKGYPIGTFIIWKTKEQFEVVRNLGCIDLPEAPQNDYVSQILDGQQRLTSAYASVNGLKVNSKKCSKDFSKMYIDLNAKENQRIVITNIQNKDKHQIISIHELMHGGLSQLAKYPEVYHKKIEDYKTIIQSYSIPIVYVEDVTIDIAIEIYTRINEGGKTLSVFEIMAAKTFSIDKNFDLYEKYDELMLNLKKVNYETIADSTVLQTVAILLVKECSQPSIYKLDKFQFIDIWYRAVDAIERAVDYFRTFYRIPASELLPYKALIIPFAYFFYHHNAKPNNIQQKYLQEFFWRTSLSERYSHSQESRIVQDIVRINNILCEKQPVYDYPVNINEQYIIENGNFSVNRSYIKSILCLYMFFEPKSFNDNSRVNISNDWLKKSNSRNYHHFFPKSFLKKNKVNEFMRNHILNITIVDEHLNKKEIGRKAPSKYMLNFIKENESINDTMKTHLINDINDYGIMYDDYDKFIQNRANVVSKEFKKRIILNNQ